MLTSNGAALTSVLHDRTDQLIIERIVQGFTDHEIAEQLSYALQSVRNRVSRILHETGARNRTHLAVLFVQAGGVTVRDMR